MVYVRYSIHMAKTIEKAIEEIAQLPEEDQEKIGRGLLSHIEKLRRLRADLQRGIDQLDAGQGAALDIETFIARMRLQYGEA